MKKIKFYPVDNGDTVLIKVGTTTIQVDSNIRSTEDNDYYDVKTDLLGELVRDAERRPHLDLFILTHPDQDHCRGMKVNYYLGDPEKYEADDKDNNLIIIDELWVTPMLFSEANSDDAKALKKEANRRRKLWEDSSTDRNKAGNRLHMIGYDGDTKFDKVPSYVPGDTITSINGKSNLGVEFFVHSPFKGSLIDGKAEADKNSTSIVMQARFFEGESDPVALYVFGGDADHYVWAEVLNQSKSHNNEDKLKYDLFLAPHHCSWTFFNDVPYENPESNKTPLESAKKIIRDYKENGAYVIASSAYIEDKMPNPPHYPAKTQYENLIGSKSHFISLAEEPNKENPKPVVFEVTKSGFTRSDKNSLSGAAGAIGGYASTGRKSSYGRE